MREFSIMTKAGRYRVSQGSVVEDRQKLEIWKFIEIQGGNRLENLEGEGIVQC